MHGSKGSQLTITYQTFHRGGSLLLHCIWLYFALSVYEREEYSLLRELGVSEVAAKLDPCFLEPDAWEALATLAVI